MQEKLEKAKALFLHAVGKLPPEAWSDYLAEARGPDAELQEQVKYFLQLHQEAGSFLEQPAAALGATGAFEPVLADDVPADQLHEGPGTVIGPYKLMEQIGEGGMGLVFVAEQQEPIRRKVALKIIKPGMDTRQVIARFEAERQALALLDHPNIAKVYDGGAIGEPSDVSRRVASVGSTRSLTRLGSPSN